MMRSKHKEGFVTLVGVLVVGAIGVATALTLLLLGLGSSRTSFVIQELHEAKGLADACIESALQEIRNNTLFSGSGSFLFDRGSCAYSVSNLGGQSRLVNATATVGMVVRKVRVGISAIIPKISITFWDEVAD